MSVFSFAAYYTKQLLFAPYPYKCRDVICQTTILPHIRRIEPLERPAVYDGELAPSVEADGYIDSVIPARRLLGL